MALKRIRDGLLIALIVACVSAILISQIYIGINRSNTTEDAVLFTSKRALSFTGIIVRDEKVVYTPFPVGDGVLAYTVSDGDRLSKTSIIANIYDSEDQIYYRHKIEKLENDIKLLEQAQNHGTTEYAQPEFLTAQIVESYKEILENIAKSDYSSVYSDSNDMLKLMNIFNITTNVELDYSERVAQLKQELSVYKAGLKTAEATVISGESGYFTSTFDGYESTLTLENIDSLTVDDIKDIIRKPVNLSDEYENAIGKVFADYSWKMVGIIDTADRYFVNQTLRFSFASSNNIHEVTVESIKPTGNGNEAIIVLSCEELDGEIASSRVQEIDLIFEEYTGLYVPREAIRFIGEDKGVYVTVGERTEFKKLNVIYEGDDYVLSKNISDDEYLNLYDRIILDPVEAKPQVELPDEQ